MPQTESPAAAPIAPLDRRALMKGGLLGLGLAAAGPGLAASSGVGFSSGVASGEPGANSVLLWTRYAASADTQLRWEVAEALDFASPVAGGSVTASAERDFCCKVVATGLSPARWYFYRFIAPDGTMSEIGRTKTLPQGPTESFRMAVFSCSNIGFGWFDAYAHAAEADAFDCTFHLGDYFYEYGPGTYPSPDEVLAGRIVQPAAELVALADYRTRYAQYRRDPDLRRLHQMYPMICVWDDHESANDSWEGGAQNHQPETEGPWPARKAAAMRAYREWMPVSDADWASYEIGDLATLFRLETRLTARSEQFDIAKVLAGNASPDDALRALETFRTGEWVDPGRRMIGAEQQQWLDAGLKASRTAGKTWQVLVQQVLMGSLSTPTGIVEQAGDVPPYIKQRLLAGAMASRAGLPMNMDSWDGYPAARSRLLSSAQEADANLIVLTGDTHNAWGFDLAENGGPAGVEFAVQGVTSPGFESFLPAIPPETMVRALREKNSALKFAETSRRGYMAVELTPARATCEWRFLNNVRQRGAGMAGTHNMTTLPGRRMLTTA
ncbi:alkaline phosphatase D family protein [Qipengyuania sp.]|uniref:alkaline phosphatase D family protein n=1 Tax=Qipengyuania sp. TaxID=2004515 RepID=UPI0035C83A7A